MPLIFSKRYTVDASGLVHSRASAVEIWQSNGTTLGFASGDPAFRNKDATVAPYASMAAYGDSTHHNNSVAHHGGRNFGSSKHISGALGSRILGYDTDPESSFDEDVLDIFFSGSSLTAVNDDEITAMPIAGVDWVAVGGGVNNFMRSKINDIFLYPDPLSTATAEWSVDTTDDQLDFTAVHGQVSGYATQFYGDDLPDPLVEHTIYYCSVIDTTTLEIFTDSGLTSQVNFTDVGSGNSLISFRSVDPTTIMKTRLTEIVDFCNTNGIRYVLLEVMPFQTYGSLQAEPFDRQWNLQRQYYCESWNAYLNATYPGRVAPLYAGMTDPANADELNPTYTGDGIHLNGDGGVAQGAIIGKVIEDYDRLTVPHGIVVEPAATNSLTDDRDPSAWTLTGSPTFAQDLTDPQANANSAYTVTVSATSEEIYDSVTQDADDLGCFSVALKKGTLTDHTIEVYDATAATSLASITNAEDLLSTTQWRQLDIPYQVESTPGSHTINCFLAASTTQTGTFGAYHAQVTPDLSYGTSLVRNGTARSAANCSMTLPVGTPLDDFTFRAVIRTMWTRSEVSDSVEGAVLISINDGTDQNYMEIVARDFSGAIRLTPRIRADGGTIRTTLNPSANTYVKGMRLDCWIVKDSAGLKFQIGGNDIWTSSWTDVFTSALTQINFGQDVDGNNPAGVIVEAVQIYDEVLTDQEIHDSDAIIDEGARSRLLPCGNLFVSTI